jgi:hypothetical protein
MRAGQSVVRLGPCRGDLGPDRRQRLRPAGHRSRGFYRYGSQVFAGEPQFDLIALDDFPLSGPTRMERLEAVIQGYGSWSGTGAIQGFVARVFASPQDAAAGWSNAVATVHLPEPAAYTPFGTGLLCGFDVDFTLQAGQWWLGVQAVMPGSNGQVGVVISDLGGAPRALPTCRRSPAAASTPARCCPLPTPTATTDPTPATCSMTHPLTATATA